MQTTAPLPFLRAIIRYYREKLAEDLIRRLASLALGKPQKLKGAWLVKSLSGCGAGDNANRGADSSLGCISSENIYTPSRKYRHVFTRSSILQWRLDLAAAAIAAFIALW